MLSLDDGQTLFVSAELHAGPIFRTRSDHPTHENRDRPDQLAYPQF